MQIYTQICIFTFTSSQLISHRFEVSIDFITEDLYYVCTRFSFMYKKTLVGIHYLTDIFDEKFTVHAIKHKDQSVSRSD